MDKFIDSYPFIEDNDLCLCIDRGVAYQKDMTITAEYDGDYFDKYVSYRGSQIADDINQGRVDFVREFVGPSASVLDVGIGCGDFISCYGPTARGFDINPKAIKWLQANDLFSNEFGRFMAVTFWDVIEHVVEPSEYLSKLGRGAFLFTSIPIFEDLNRIRESKHYRPGEHLYYWTKKGFIEWMGWHGFDLFGFSDFETKAGRDSIASFAFVKTE